MMPSLPCRDRNIGALAPITARTLAQKKEAVSRNRNSFFLLDIQAFSLYIARSNTSVMKTRIPCILTFILLVSLMSFTSCNRVKELAAFDVIYTLPPTNFTYTPGVLKGDGEELIYSGAIEANLDSILEANGFTAGVVGNTQFVECTITITPPSTLTFGWLQSARGEIADNPEFSPAREVGSVFNDNPEATSVVLLVNNTNIRPYLGSKFFYFRVFGVLTGPPPAEWIEMVIEGKLLMHLEPLN